jgi:Flp pilus assembly protein TadG
MNRQHALRRQERGMVTAEAALVIPVLLAVTLLLSWAITVGAAQVRLIDAAREGARLAARGESEQAVQEAIQRAGPDGVTGRVTVLDDSVRVDVDTEVAPGVPLLGDLPGIGLDSSATAALEEVGSP